jgi:hypothetical protein
MIHYQIFKKEKYEKIISYTEFNVIISLYENN